MNKWEAKEKYIKNLNKQNEENGNVTKEQHHAIQSVASMRHKLHVDGFSALYNSENSQNAELMAYLFNKEGSFGGEIEEIIKENGLPEIKWSEKINAEDLPCDVDVELGRDKEEVISELSAFLEKINLDIENWLHNIDASYGTNYAPTGIARKNYI